MFFLKLPCFLHDSMKVDNLICGSSVPSEFSLYIWKFLVHVLLKPSLRDFEHNFASMWNKHNCTVLWTFFGIALLWDWNKNWPFPILWPLLSFLSLLAHWGQHLNGIVVLGVMKTGWNFLLLCPWDSPDNNTGVGCHFLLQMSKASGGDGIPVELFQILKDDAVKLLHSIWKLSASKFGKLSSGHRTGKGQFSFQSQRRAMPKNAQTTAQLHSSHMLVK